VLDITPLKPNFDLRKVIEKETLADSYMCWTCSSCDGECPINITTNKLRPQKIVHMAYVGLLEELLTLPEIWYCLTCRKCNRTCPNKVKPADLIAFARKELARRKTIPYDTIQKYQEYFSRLQRIRFLASSLGGKHQGPTAGGLASRRGSNRVFGRDRVRRTRCVQLRLR